MSAFDWQWRDPAADHEHGSVPRPSIRSANPGRVTLAALATLLVGATVARASYTNFEASHVHPIALTPAGGRLLAVNTPDALLEVFAVAADGSLVAEAAIPVGLEPVTVVARTDAEAWVVNWLSDTVSVVDLTQRVVATTLAVGDEPTDVAFAGGRAFVTVSGEDRMAVFDLADLTAPPVSVGIDGARPRAVAVANDRSEVYVVVQDSGNQTTVVNANIVFGNNLGLDPVRLAGFGLDDLRCHSPPPPYPPLPAGITRNPTLIDPPSGVPRVGLIARWNDATGKWEDVAGADWTPCLPFRLPDHDLFRIDVGSLAVTTVDHLGTTLLDVSVRPVTGEIFVAQTEARNFVRFEHPLGLRGHVVDNRLAVVDSATGAATLVDLNAHIDRGSDPATNLAERLASLSQPGMMAWTADGSVGYVVGIGSRKLFRLDGACRAGPCLFGADRAVPDAVEVGDGPTGVVLAEAKSRLYVLNRFSNSIAIVDDDTLTRIAEVPLHDPSPPSVPAGRRLLYDAVLGSGHGDAACSSCHISGDRDALAWDLGNPEGELVRYDAADDNVRFVIPLAGSPVPCDPRICGSHLGFDPQKGPMTTQTLRGMLEPLHWRGDRATFNDFNSAFVALMGTADIGAAGRPAGLTPADMELFRQFALGIRLPPNPHRLVNDTLPFWAPIPGTSHSGNPARGSTRFDTLAVAGGEPCVACHTHPFGAAGGRLGGVTPVEPTSPQAAALFNGDQDRSPHNDLKIPHLRNLYQKVGPRFGVSTTPAARSGFGLTHDGSIPDLLTFLSANLFTLDATEAADLAAFMVRFPTGTKPCVGRQVTLPAGPPPTGTPAEELLLGQLLALADADSAGRHGELVAAVPRGSGAVPYHLFDGLWRGESAAEPAVATAALRALATGPITFTCAPLGSGPRLGGDRDDDGAPNLDDCRPLDPTTWGGPEKVPRLVLEPGLATHLSWDEPASAGADVVYEVVGGLLSDLRVRGLGPATDCLKGDLVDRRYEDSRPEPAAGDGYYYFVRGRNGCGPGDFGPGRGAIAPLDCTGK